MGGCPQHLQGCSTQHVDMTDIVWKYPGSHESGRSSNLEVGTIECASIDCIVSPAIRSQVAANAQGMAMRQDESLKVASGSLRGREVR
jgi:hypothetical protein